MSNKARVSLAALCALAALTGCSSTESDAVAEDCTPASTFSTIKDGTLSIVGPDYPPLFTFEHNELGGVDGKILEGFAQANCLKTTTKVLPAAGVIEAVKGGQGDIAAGGWYPTEERAQIVAQTEPAYADPAVLVGNDPSSNLEDYEGKRVGTTQGYLWVEDLQKWAGNDVKLYASPDAVFQDLLAGRIDVAMMATDEAAYRLAQATDSGLTYVKINPTPLVEATQNPSVTNLPHTKDNTELTDALNTYLDSIRQDGKLAKILDEYGIDPDFADPSLG